MNFQEIVQQILNSGMTQAEIKERCNCGQSTVSDILKGHIKNPSYTIGSALIALHKERYPDSEASTTE